MAERVFRNLHAARDEVSRGLLRMNEVVEDISADLAAAQGLGDALARDDDQGNEVRGLVHCLKRARERLGDLEEMRERLHGAAVVVHGNDPTRLSAEALRYSPGPHKEDYSQGLDAEPRGGEAAHV